MSKIKDFENAPIGATATRANGHRAMKVNDGVRGWITPRDSRLSDRGMMIFGYVLDPSAPTSAREALAMGLNIAWDLAHEVKGGQLIPKGTQYLMLHNSGLMECTAQIDFEIKPYLASIARTLDPLPDPEPDWLDAPAVLATHEAAHDYANPSVWAKDPFDNDRWINGPFTSHWQNLRDVTPLYQKETEK